MATPVKYNKVTAMFFALFDVSLMPYAVCVSKITPL